jgi:AraC-like DNA-binding protein/quercetin dioxygenase-like cupin family protein
MRNKSRHPVKIRDLGDLRHVMPTPDRPVRCRASALASDEHLRPHHHPWSQLAYCASGLIQVTVDTDQAQTTYILPPSRAVWIPPQARHAVAVVETAQVLTLYLDPAATPRHWTGCRVVTVSALLRELIQALQDIGPGRREQALMELVLDDLVQADTLPLGVPMPRDKRLRSLCERVLHAPGERSRMAEWAGQIGASERTVNRLFRTELGTSYQQWRQQVVLAHALPLLARGMPVGLVAASTGYASDSAFSAMFKAAMGQSPSQFQAGKLAQSR